MLDLVLYLLIVLGGYQQEDHNSSPVPLLHSALVASTLYLLTGFISSQWQDIALVLVAHPKVDIFMDVAFGAVHKAIRFLHIKLSGEDAEFCMRLSPIPERIVSYLCQQCEASLQLLQSLCQQKVFRERLLRNKELCRRGGVLHLAHAVLKLNIAPAFIESATVVAAVSRLKAKVLSVLLHLCEAESVSYLDEVASSTGSMDLAKSIALEVLEILKTALGRDPKHLSTCSDIKYPMGLLQLNAMRLADIFSDDSNFRSYIMSYFTEVLTAMFSLSHGDFLSMWCSSKLPVKEDDATLEYDLFAAAGWVLDTFSSDLSEAINLEITLIPSNIQPGYYAHQRTSLFVKVIANLHCFVPNICEEQERNYFLNKFLECLQIDPSKSLPGFSFTSGTHKAETVCRNLRSLLSHAESLISSYLNEDDVQLLRVFFNQLQSLIAPVETEENQIQEAQSAVGSSPQLGKGPPNLDIRNGSLKEEMSENSAVQENQVNVKNEPDDDVTREDRREDGDISGGTDSGVLREIDREIVHVETSGSDTSSTRGKNFVGQTDNGEYPKAGDCGKESGFDAAKEDVNVESVQFGEKQPRKRKRTIMNDKQISLMERALLDEPEMQRNAASLQSWADKLTLYGSEVTPSQIKNWLNNRKARLARAGKEARAPAEVENSLPEKQGVPLLGHALDSTENPDEDLVPSSGRCPRSMSRIGLTEKSESNLKEVVDTGAARFLRCKPGQYVLLVGGQGEEIGKGRVHQVHGQWSGKNLQESETYVVDVTELKAERRARLPYPSEVSGTSFEEAETNIGVMRVLWDSKKMYVLQSQ
ncbi:nodulin homeobox isoform X2 [Tripterygium wilfordii]|nr:nodulin homeobox isoform X2 [Tripterygium wilfordii]